MVFSNKKKIHTSETWFVHGALLADLGVCFPTNFLLPTCFLDYYGTFTAVCFYINVQDNADMSFACGKISPNPTPH